MLGISSQQLTQLESILGIGQPPSQVLAQMAGIAGGIGSDLAVGFARRLGANAIGALGNAVTRDIEYAANTLGPTIVPPVEQLVNMYYSGFISRSMLTRFASNHGVDFRTFTGAADNAHPRARLWRQVLAYNTPNYPVAFLRKLGRQGNSTADRLLLRALEREGFRTSEEQGLFIDEYNPLDAATAFNLYFRGRLTEQQLLDTLKIIGWRDTEARQLLQAAYRQLDGGILQRLRYRRKIDDDQQRQALTHLGFKNDDISNVLDTQWNTFSDQQVLFLRNAGLITTDDDARQYLGYNGWNETQNTNNVIRTRFAQPTLADAILLGNRVVAGDGINRFRQMDSAMPDQYKVWASRLGYSMSAVSNVSYGEEDEDNSWGKVAWNNQWRLPDLSMLAQFLHRFRGDPNNQQTWSLPNVRPLTLDESNALLTANGIADSLKPYIYNLMYSPLNLRHIQLIVRYMPVDINQVAAWLQDNGISPPQSQILAATYIEKRQEELNRPIVVQREKALAKLQRSIEDAYATGTLDNGTALAELTANGMDPAAATTTLAAIDVSVANELSTEVIKRARSDVFAGIVQIGAIAPRLIQSGIAPPRVAQLIATWTAQLSMGRKTLGTDKIMRYLRKGFINRDTAMVRLNNLGWQGTDLLLLLSDVQAEIAGDTAKTIAASEREKVAEERAIERQVNRMGTLYDSLVSRLKVLTPVSKVIKWYKSGLWSEDRTRKRLRLMLYTDDVIDTMLLDALGTSSKPGSTKGGGK